jgi:hypothetical protein
MLLTPGYVVMMLLLPAAWLAGNGVNWKRVLGLSLMVVFLLAAMATWFLRVAPLFPVVWVYFALLLCWLPAKLRWSLGARTAP